MLILSFVVSLLLSGCSNSNEVKLDPKYPVTINIWHYYHGMQKTAFDDAVKQFNDTVGYEKGIIVEAVSYGGVVELAANVLSAAKGELDAGDMPDIFGSYGDMALEIAKLDKAADISQYMTEKELFEYEETFIKEGRIGTDKLYVFPIAKATESLLLNKTDFDAFVNGLSAAGFNESVSYDDLATWEGISRVSDLYYKYTEALYGRGKAFLGIDVLANYIIIGTKQLGEDLVKVTDGSVSIDPNVDVMYKVWSAYYDHMVQGRFAKLGRFCSDDIKTGDTLGFIGSTTGASYFPNELILADGSIKNIEMTVLPMPIFEGGDKVAVSQGAGMVIAKSTKEKEYASSIFLKWFTESDKNVHFSLSSGYLPVKKESLADSYLTHEFESIGSGDEVAKNSIKALKMGIEQLKEYTLYSQVFDGSMEFREKLPLALEAAVKDDMAVYRELLNSGLSPEDAYKSVLENSKLKFDQWLNSLKRQG